MMNHVELGRRFRILDKAAQEGAETAIGLYSGLLVKTGWPDILARSRVVILAEAGSGKTAEMKEQVRLLRARGEAAVFVPIEVLGQEDLAAALAPSDLAVLDSWKRGDLATAWLFLDAVDELKLTRGRFDTALKRVARAIDGQLHRARVVLSCRPSDWRVSADLLMLRELLPVPSEMPKPTVPAEAAFLAAFCDNDTSSSSDETASTEDVLVVTLQPLDREQVRTCAVAMGVLDSSAFLAEIDRQDAWPFAHRPLDLADLVAAWRQNGRLGTLQEQHEANVAAKLKEAPDRRDGHAPDERRLRQGAERLGLALSLTRMLALRSPELAVNVDNSIRAMDAGAVLNDWQQAERQSLLGRALFDPATYGRVRFHHRSVQEYLAARRLKSLRDGGMPTKALHALLFGERYGLEVVVPTMRPIAAWLSLWDDGVRRELTRRQPEALLALGDPGSLPLAARAEVLGEFAARYGQDGWRGLEVPGDSLRRLAHPGLEPAIRAAWSQSSPTSEVRGLLIALIDQGALRSCVDLAEEAATDAALPDHHRLIAVRAIKTCGDIKCAERIAESCRSSPSAWPLGLLAHVIEELFPIALSPVEMVLLAARVKGKSAERTVARTLDTIVDSLDPVSKPAADVRALLADAVWNGRNESAKMFETDGRFNHFVPALAKLCRRQLDSSVGGSLYRDCAIAAWFHEPDNRVDGTLHQLRLAARQPGRRQEAFLAQLELFDRVKSPPEAWRRLGSVLRLGLAVETEQGDSAWLSELAADAGRDLRHREVAVEALLRLWRLRRGSEDDGRELRALIAHEPQLVSLVDAGLLPPAPEDPRIAEMDAEHQRLVDAEKARRDRGLSEWKEWRQRLVDDPVRAFSAAEAPKTLGAICTWLSARSENSNRYNAWDWDALMHVFGEDVAARTRHALKAHWRAQAPSMWSQRPEAERNSVLNGWIWGLTGIAAEAEQQGWASRLSPAEARLAAAYAPIELNGFPDWLSQLAGVHPVAVEAVIGDEWSRECQLACRHDHLPVVQNVAHGAIEVTRLLVPRGVQLLSEWGTVDRDGSCNRGPHHLEDVIQTVIRAATDDERAAIATICATAFSADVAGPWGTPWLRGLMQTDLRQGVASLESALATLSDDPARKAYAVSRFAALFGSHQRGIAFDSAPEDRAPLLAKLLRIAHRYVRPAEDISHDGVYTPGVRDEAQHVRSALLGALIECPGPEAHLALEALVAEEGLLHLPARVQQLMGDRAGREMDLPVMEPSGFPEFERRFEALPVGRDALFQLMRDRVDDIAHHLAHDDFSDRVTLAQIGDEGEMQRTLAARLRQEARGAYTVSRESEVADSKRPDIRLTAAKGEQVSIEVKIADSWTLVELNAALRDQLVGQYLRHRSGSAGCLLLTRGRKRFWTESATRRRLSFDKLVEHLAAEARLIERGQNFRIRVTCMGIDLRSPLTGTRKPSRGAKAPPGRRAGANRRASRRTPGRRR